MKEKFLIEEPKKFGLKPDIVIYDAEDLLIADTKWKVIQNEKDISQSDMYQLYAYGTKFTKCSELYLIYPYDQHELALKYIYQKKDSRVLALYVLFFDLISDRLLFYPQETEKETRLIHLIQ